MKPKESEERAYLRLGFTSSGDIRIEGEGLSLEEAAHAFGQVLNEVGRDNLPEDCRSWCQRRDYFHRLARIFCQGMQVDENAISWRNAEDTEEMSHDWLGREEALSQPIVVAVSGSSPSDGVHPARYSFEKKLFQTEDGNIIKDVCYWRPLPKTPIDKD